MFGAVGAPIDRLVRVRMGPVRLDDLASGRARRLRAPEVRGLGAGAGVEPRWGEDGAVECRAARSSARPEARMTDTVVGGARPVPSDTRP